MSTLPPQLLARLGDLVADRLGLHFPPARWRELEAGIGAAARRLGRTDLASYAQTLLSAPPDAEQIEILARTLTVGETYFFRDQTVFDALAAHVLPELIRRRATAGRSLRLWSAGCSTGEEPYSLAILLDRMLQDADAWRVTLLGTDVNPEALENARAGIFGQWSFRETPASVKTAYFRNTRGRKLELLPRIREKVTFAHLNLVEVAREPDSMPMTAAMDVILCRNVLMYFEPERAERVIDYLHRSLVPGGWLIVSAAEACSRLLTDFEPVQFGDVTFYRKPAADASREFRPIHHEAIRLYAAPEEPEEICTDHAPPASDTAVRADTSSPENLARMCANRGEHAQALHWAEQALAADKLNADMHYLRALVLQEQGHTEEAYESLKRTLYVMPQFVLAHVALGNLVRRLGRQTEARQHLNNALSLLAPYSDGDEVPESDGLAVGLLRETIRTALKSEPPS